MYPLQLGANERSAFLVSLGLPRGIGFRDCNSVLAAMGMGDAHRKTLIDSLAILLIEISPSREARNELLSESLLPSSLRHRETSIKSRAAFMVPFNRIKLSWGQTAWPARAGALLLAVPPELYKW